MSDTHVIKFTKRAAADLAALDTFIRQSSDQNALAMAKQIVEAIDSLGFMPSRYRVVGTSRKRKTPVRSILVYPYLIYYAVDDTRLVVHVLAIIHGARRRPRRFD